jgi:hypothetical protein
MNHSKVCLLGNFENNGMNDKNNKYRKYTLATILVLNVFTILAQNLKQHFIQRLHSLNFEN